VSDQRESEYVEDFVAAGIYDPGAPDAAAQLELLEWLVDEIEASIPEIVQAHEDGGMLSFAAFRSLNAGRDRFTFAEAANRAGVEYDFAVQVWRSAGFPEPRQFERKFGPQDVEMLRLFGALEPIVSREQVIQLVRTVGESVARVADAEVAMLRSQVEAPLAPQARYVEVARTYVELAVELFPRIADSLDNLHRHHLQAIGRRYSDVAARPSALNVVQLAVGFGDLAGYTGLWHKLPPDELAEMLARFEATTGDVIAASGANVVKRIGDAVMFVTNAPGVACRLALELLEACARAGLPKLRVGLSFGDVMVRQGDFYGGTVNLAARLVASAEAGTALADTALYERLARVRSGYTFMPAGRYSLAGFQEPVSAYQLLRP
jgi:class 3 adenylate cyclase